MTTIIAFLKKWVFYLIGLIFILLIAFTKGCSYGRGRVKCPEVVTNTVIKHDTVQHYIYNIWPWYFDGKDSIVYKDVPAKIDTFAIFKDYYALHFSQKQWRDSLLEVTLDMMISENKFYPQEFSYKILRPQVIITNVQDNSVHYAKYLYVGGSVPVNDIKYADLGLFYAFPAGLFGLGYNPALKSLQVTGAVKLFKFK